MSKKLTNEEFIEKAKRIHKEKYDYSEVIYKDWKSKVIVIDELGFKHSIIPNGLLNGNKLSFTNLINKNEYLIYQFKKIHGDKYDYSSMNCTHIKEKINICCIKHGEFKQTIDNHIKGKGCPRCNGKNRTSESIINEFKLIHGNKYDYSKVIYKGIKSKIKIMCSTHGEFDQVAETHLQGSGCPICKESWGERKIRLFLDRNNMVYNSQYKFDGCVHILKLPFDFYLPDYNMCIEFQGEQHFKPVNFFGGVKMFEIRKIRDKIKEEFCRNNNIKLVIIRYDVPLCTSLKYLAQQLEFRVEFF